MALQPPFLLICHTLYMVLVPCSEPLAFPVYITLALSPCNIRLMCDHRSIFLTLTMTLRGKSEFSAGRELISVFRVVGQRDAEVFMQNGRS